MNKDGEFLRSVINVKGELIYMARAWDKEKSESPTGIEPMTSRTPGGREFICDRRAAYC